MTQHVINRRHFAALVAAGALAGAPLAVQSASADPPAKAPVEPSSPDAPTAAPDPPVQQASPDPAALVLERVKQQYPDRLEPAHLDQIRAQIERHLAISRILSEFPLTNADEPAPVFAAYRKEQ